MTTREALVEQHVREFEARLKHFDELYAKARKAPDVIVGTTDELTKLRREREELLNEINELRSKSSQEWQGDTIEKSGPMIVWQALAKRIEHLIERLER